MQLVGALAPGDLPPMLDIEETGTSPEQWAGVAEADRVPLVLTWLDQVEAALGLRPILYTRAGFIEQYFPDPGGLVNDLLWVAHYTSKPAPSLPPGWDDWTIWQFSEKGEVAGVSGPVDLDRFNGTLDDLRARACAPGLGDSAGRSGDGLPAQQAAARDLTFAGGGGHGLEGELIDQARMRYDSQVVDLSTLSRESKYRTGRTSGGATAQVP